jgi:hypothetical protein
MQEVMSELRKNTILFRKEIVGTIPISKYGVLSARTKMQNTNNMIWTIHSKH